MARVCAGVNGATLFHFPPSQPSKASPCSIQRGIEAISNPLTTNCSTRKAYSLSNYWTMQERTGKAAASSRCISKAVISNIFLAGKLAKRPLDFGTARPKFCALTYARQLLERKPVLDPPADHLKQRAAARLGMFAMLLYAAPAQAAKYVPPALGTSDPVPVPDEFTIEDLGGLAMLGIILLMVFLIGNVLLPSLMFSDADTAVPYKRDEEGDFYHDPSFTKDFFREARENNEDIDEVSWSQAPFSKLAHGFSKILPPPSSVASPPEVSKKVNKGLGSLEGTVGAGVKLSGIVVVPGYGSDIVNGGQVGNGQATSAKLPPRSASTSAGSDASLRDAKGGTAIERGAKVQGSVGAVKEVGFEQALEAYKQELEMVEQAKTNRLHERTNGLGLD